MRRAIAVLFVLPLAGSVLRAQDQVGPALTAGAKVRVTVGGVRIVGTLARYDADSIALVREQVTYRWPRHSVATVEVGERRSRLGPTLGGMTIGIVVGGGVGALLLGTSQGAEDNFFGPEFAYAVGAFFGGIAGGLTGGIVGYNRSPWRWTETPVHGVGVRPFGRGIGVSVAF